MPIVVAVNKIDKPGANVERVMGEMAEKVRRCWCSERAASFAALSQCFHPAF